MKKVQFYNENGNALNGTRKLMKSNVEENVSLGKFELLRNDKGELYAQVAEDEATGTPIYAVISVTVSDRDVPSRAKNKKEDVDNEKVVLDLFD